MLELDYAGAAELFAEGDLVLDESAADIAASLQALELGNFDEAGTSYGRVAPDLWMKNATGRTVPTSAKAPLTRWTWPTNPAGTATG